MKWEGDDDDDDDDDNNNNNNNNNNNMEKGMASVEVNWMEMAQRCVQRRLALNLVILLQQG
jgi:hypothetical protein